MLCTCGAELEPGRSYAVVLDGFVRLRCDECANDDGRLHAESDEHRRSNREANENTQPAIPTRRHRSPAPTTLAPPSRRARRLLIASLATALVASAAAAVVIWRGPSGEHGPMAAVAEAQRRLQRPETQIISLYSEGVCRFRARHRAGDQLRSLGPSDCGNRGEGADTEQPPVQGVASRSQASARVRSRSLRSRFGRAPGARRWWPCSMVRWRTSSAGDIDAVACMFSFCTSTACTPGTCTLDDILDGLSVGDQVQAREMIGSLGKTGIQSSDPHLHFAVSAPAGDGWKFVDPAPPPGESLRPRRSRHHGQDGRRDLAVARWLFIG